MDITVKDISYDDETERLVFIELTNIPEEFKNVPLKRIIQRILKELEK